MKNSLFFTGIFLFTLQVSMMACNESAPVYEEDGVSLQNNDVYRIELIESHLVLNGDGCYLEWATNIFMDGNTSSRHGCYCRKGEKCETEYYTDDSPIQPNVPEETSLRVRKVMEFIVDDYKTTYHTPTPSECDVNTYFVFYDRGSEEIERTENLGCQNKIMAESIELVQEGLWDETDF